jgi:hypothetical protein
MTVDSYELRLATLHYVSVIVCSYIVWLLYDLEHNDVESCA